MHSVINEFQFYDKNFNLVYSRQCVIPASSKIWGPVRGRGGGPKCHKQENTVAYMYMP